jgi:transcriptional regulator with XRE-family HTH domain
MPGVADEPEGGGCEQAVGWAWSSDIVFNHLVHLDRTLCQWSREVNTLIVMDRDAARVRGTALRAFLAARLPVPGARSVTALARKAGIQPTTATSWWTKGYVPDNTSLRLLADALGVELSELVTAYEGSAGPTWVLTSPQLQELVDRGAEAAVRRVLAERDSLMGPGDRADSKGRPSAAPTPSETADPPGPPTRGPRRVKP